MSNINDTQPIHPLRQRMIEDMTLRGLSAPSQKAYIRAARRCSEHLGVRPAGLEILPFSGGFATGLHAACFRFMAGVIPPRAMFGRSLL